MSIPDDALDSVEEDAADVAVQEAASSSPPWGLTTKAIFTVFALLLIVIVVWRFRGLLQPLILAVILAYLLLPIIGFVERRFGWQRGWSVLLVYALVLTVWVTAGFYLGVLGVDQTNRLLGVLPGVTELTIERVSNWLTAVTGQSYQIGPAVILVPDIGQLLQAARLEEQALTWTRQIVGQGGPLVVTVASSIFSVVGVGFVVLITSIYIARDMPRFGQLISDLAHQPGYRRDADRLIEEFVRIWNAYLRGQVILALVIGAVVSLGLSALGVRYALALGTLAGLLEFLPIVGPVISTVTAMIVAYFFPSSTFGAMNPLLFAGIVLAFMFVVQQVENGVLVPRIVGGALDLHPLVIIVAVMMGASLAGILGAILAAPVAASVKLLGVYGWRKLLDLPPFVGESDAGEKEKREEKEETSTE